MIIYKKQNIVETDCKAIAHGVNCQGVMNSGVAKSIRNNWPEAYESYMAYCNYYNESLMKPPLGFVNVLKTKDGKWIGNCFTQEYYGYDKKRYAHPIAVLNSLYQFSIDLIQYTDVREIAIPKIGCGRGGLDWETEIKPIIEKISLDLGINFVVYDND